MLDNEDSRRANRSKRDEGNTSTEPGAMMRKNKQWSRHAAEKMREKELKRVNREHQISCGEVEVYTSILLYTTAFVPIAYCST